MLSAVLIILAFLLGKITRPKPAPGGILFLSLNGTDVSLLESGKVCNSRTSKNQELAEKAHGETGIKVQVLEHF